MSKLSNQTFIEQIQNGNLKSKKHIVYSFLKDNGRKTLEQMRRTIPMSHQTLTARLSDLMDEGLVWQDDSNQFFVTEESYWHYYAAKREKERYQKWLKVGKKNGWI